MRIKLKTFLIGWAVVILLALLVAVRTYGGWADKVDLHGGSFSTKSMSIWQLYRFKEVTLKRKEPLIWTPWRSHVAVDNYVTVTSHDNLHWLNINADLVELLRSDAEYNKTFAKRFKVHGTRKQQIRQIYRYCVKTQYIPHVKTARDVFERHQGDCAAIASAFYVLCKAHHIPVRYIIGWTSSGCHAWNRVKLKGRWYWIDCTYKIFLTKKLKRKILCKW